MAGEPRRRAGGETARRGAVTGFRGSESYQKMIAFQP